MQDLSYVEISEAFQIKDTDAFRRAVDMIRIRGYPFFRLDPLELVTVTELLTEAYTEMPVAQRANPSLMEKLDDLPAGNLGVGIDVYRDRRGGWQCSLNDHMTQYVDVGRGTSRERAVSDAVDEREKRLALIEQATIRRKRIK